MKNVNVKNKIKGNNMQCDLCHANFEIWLNNLNLNEERKEKISQHLLKYCPVCEKAGIKK